MAQPNVVTLKTLNYVTHIKPTHCRAKEKRKPCVPCCSGHRVSPAGKIPVPPSSLSTSHPSADESWQTPKAWDQNTWWCIFVQTGPGNRYTRPPGGVHRDPFSIHLHFHPGVTISVSLTLHKACFQIDGTEQSDGEKL